MFEPTDAQAKDLQDSVDRTVTWLTDQAKGIDSDLDELHDRAAGAGRDSISRVVLECLDQLIASEDIDHPYEIGWVIDQVRPMCAAATGTPQPPDLTVQMGYLTVVESLSAALASWLPTIVDYAYNMGLHEMAGEIMQALEDLAEADPDATAEDAYATVEG